MNIFKFVQIWSRLNLKNCKNSQGYTGIIYFWIGRQITEKIGKIRKSLPFGSIPNSLQLTIPASFCKLFGSFKYYATQDLAIYTGTQSAPILNATTIMPQSFGFIPQSMKCCFERVNWVTKMKYHTIRKTPLCLNG